MQVLIYPEQLPSLKAMGAMTQGELNQIWRNIGRMVRASGGTFCFTHGLTVPGCGCRGSCPDLSLFVFGGLHKKDVVTDAT